MNEDGPRFDYEVAEEVGKRLNVFFEGLPKEQVQAALEELIDDYCSAQFNTTIIQEMRKVRLKSKGNCITIQPVADGKGILVSSYGFEVRSESKMPNGTAFLVLAERTKEQFWKEQESMG